MATMFPLLLAPSIKDYLWGGRRLADEFGYPCKEKAAEAWVLSCHKEGPSIVRGGPLDGRPLPQVLEEWGPAALGERAAAFPYFPLLIKLIDARDRLSIQVHPDDAYALRTEGEYGKTEMWYVLDCKPGARLIYGLDTGLTREQFREHIEKGTVTEVCNFVPVHKGDVFFIEAGTLHAIGEGILIAEVQQNSNTTYRVSDYGRLGADGRPRPLHVDKAVEVTRLAPPGCPTALWAGNPPCRAVLSAAWPPATCLRPSSWRWRLPCGWDVWRALSPCFAWRDREAWNGRAAFWI